MRVFGFQVHSGVGEGDPWCPDGIGKVPPLPPIGGRRGTIMVEGMWEGGSWDHFMIGDGQYGVLFVHTPRIVGARWSREYGDSLNGVLLVHTPRIVGERTACWSAKVLRDWQVTGRGILRVARRAILIPGTAVGSS